MTSVRVGAKLPVALQLPDGATDKYVRAWAYGADGTLVQGPVNLGHVATGLYLTREVSMPDQEFVAVQYRVYEDSAYQSLSVDHGETLDVISREEVTDLGAVASSEQLYEVRDELLQTLAHKQNQVKVTVSALSSTDELEFQVWLNRDGAPVETPSSASMSVFGSDGLVVFNLGPVNTCSEKGVFRMVKTSASAAVVSGNSYTVYATVGVGSATYASITAITVF